MPNTQNNIWLHSWRTQSYNNQISN